jgi:hypothetical protein
MSVYDPEIDGPRSGRGVHLHDPGVYEKGRATYRRRLADGLPAVSLVKRIDRVVEKLAAIERIEEGKQPDVAKEVFSIMLLDACPDDPEGRTYLELIGSVLIQKAIHGEDVEGDVTAINILLNRAFGKPAENGGMLKQVKKLFAAIEFITPESASQPALPDKK